MRQEDGLTAHAHRLLDILQVRGDWTSGAELAHELGRKYLPSYSVRLLQTMAELGLTEVRISPGKNGFDLTSTGQSRPRLSMGRNKIGDKPMPSFGYFLIDDEKWRVKVIQRKTRRALILRPRDTFDGKHLKGVQVFLEQPENRWLLDHLRYGETIYVPLRRRDRPTPPAANEV